MFHFSRKKNYLLSGRMPTVPPADKRYYYGVITIETSTGDLKVQ